MYTIQTSITRGLLYLRHAGKMPLFHALVALHFCPRTE